MLKSIYLGFRKVKVQKVTVVEFGMYNRGGDGVGCLEVKIGANAAQLTNVIVAGPERDDIITVKCPLKQFNYEFR